MASSSDKRNNAVAHVARRQHVEVLAQPAAGAAVIADGDHGAKFGDGDGPTAAESELARAESSGFARGSSSRRRCDVLLQSLQQGGKSGAAANGKHAQFACACECRLLVKGIGV